MFGVNWVWLAKKRCKRQYANGQKEKLGNFKIVEQVWVENFFFKR